MKTAYVDVEGANFVVTFPYDEDLVKLARKMPSRAFDRTNKCWRAPIVAGNQKYLERMSNMGRFELSAAAEHAVTGNVANAQTVTYGGGNTMHVHLPRTHAVQEMLGPLFAVYMPDDRLWSMRLAAHSVVALDKLVEQGKLIPSPEAEAEIAKRLPAAQEQLERYKQLGARSAAAAADMEIDGLGGELRPYQKAGVAYALETGRCMNADVMGLGKTIQALATLQAKENRQPGSAFPAVIVTPAIVKLNWEREVRKWLPGKSVEVLSGMKVPDSLPMMLPDIWIINYDVLHAWQEWLAACGVKALILDESHYVKNPSAIRTVAAKRLAEQIPEDGIVLLLTGTPVLNRAQELISQLDIMGRLKDLGGKKYFLSRYVDWAGKSINPIELHRRLRATCYVRREKSEVLIELPDKERATVLLDVKLGVAYATVKKEVVGWLREHKNDKKTTDATRRAKLDVLKEEITKAKLPVAIEWIENFLESGNKLVVFAYHIAQQEALVEAFPDCVHIMGRDSHQDRQDAVDAFQSDGPDSPQLIVCSLKAAGVGITLTAASDVVFLEMGWTPADQDQAEDRCHRLGQHDSVTAHYLLARGSEDVEIAELIDAKRQTTTAITEGREATEEESIVTSLTRKLLAEGAGE